MKTIRFHRNKDAKLSVFFAVFLYLALVFCFEPKLFVKWTPLNALFIVGLVVAFVSTIVLYWREGESFPVIFYWIVVYMLTFFLQTAIGGGDILMWGYMSIVLMTLCLVIHFFIQRNAFAVLDTIIHILTVLLTLNLLVSFVFPGGVVASIYFTGIRTRFTDLVFPLLACNFIEFFSVREEMTERYKKFRLGRFIAVIAICVIVILKFKIATAILGLAFAVGVFFIFWKLPKLRNIWLIIGIALLVNYLMVFVDITQYFKWLISGVLGKDANLSGRTEIWRIATGIVKQNLVFGHGMADNGGFVYWSYNGEPHSYWQAHNQWLQLLYDGGLILVVAFVWLLGITGKKVKYADEKVSSVFLACISAFMVMMIAEIYTYTPYLFIMIFLSQYLDYFGKYKKEKALQAQYGQLYKKLNKQ